MKNKIDFRKYFAGENFVTPEKLGYFRTKNIVIELSTGSEFLGIIPYGVTVRDIKTRKEPESELSRCFFSREDAEEYIKYLCDNY